MTDIVFTNPDNSVVQAATIVHGQMDFRVHRPACCNRSGGHFLDDGGM
jgi:hypothetical protein